MLEHRRREYGVVDELAVVKVVKESCETKPAIQVIKKPELRDGD